MKIILILCGISALYKGTFSEVGPLRFPSGQKVTVTPFERNVSSRVRVETEYDVKLCITKLTTEDAGQYTCMSSDSSASFNLTVIRLIVLDASLAEQSTPEGSTFKMKCIAQGQGQTAIFWKVNNRIPNPPKYRVMEDGLLIHNVTQQDAKVNYVCRAMDTELHTAKLMNITLKVRMKPRLVKGNSKTEFWGVLGEWANLTCAVDAYPPPTFEWVHRNKTLYPSDEVYPLNVDNISILQVLVRRDGNFGIYTCKAKNSLGSIERVMYLYKAQKPQTPFLELELIVHNAAKIRVKFLKSGGDTIQDPAMEDDKKKGVMLPITRYVVQYKKVTQGGWITANATKYDRGFIVKGLTPGMAYFVRAASSNVVTQGDFSAPIRIITLKDFPGNNNTAENQLHSVFAEAINLFFIHIGI